MFIETSKSLIEIRFFDNLWKWKMLKTQEVVANYMETYYSWLFVELIIRTGGVDRSNLEPLHKWRTK